MQVPNYLKRGLALVLLTTPVLTNAQAPTKDEKTTAIQKIAGQIAAHYVYPERGGQIASHLQMANHEGGFEKASSWEEFDRQVTMSVQKFSKDQHLYIKYDPELAATLDRGDAENTVRMYLQEGELSSSSGIAEAKVLDGNVGYLKLSTINITKGTLAEYNEAIKRLKETDALIIDLRNNSGGGSELGAVLESYFLPEGTRLLDFSSRDGKVKKVTTVDWIEERYEKPVYIIINKNTASAAEAFAFVLQQHNRAKVVGETSAGAAYMNELFAVDGNSYISVSTSVPHLPGTDRNWQDQGVRPDIKVKKGDPVSEILSLKPKA